jgi:uncharacterized protein (TIGR02599 family)
MSDSVPPTTRRQQASGRDREAFTLVELLLACAVFAVMLVLMAVAISQMSTGIRTSSAKVEAFASAREAMANVTRTLSTATLNTYWDYFTVSGNTNYGRQSDLQFVITNQSAMVNIGGAVTHAVFFQTPLGYTTNNTLSIPPGTLNACGFFTAYGSDVTQPAFSGISASKPRFRLYQWLPSTESLVVNSNTGTLGNWFGGAVLKTNNIAFGARPLADNIVAFVLRVPDTNNPTTATNYWWNSLTTWSSGSQPNQMNELPPFVEITMVAMDETVVNRLAGNAPGVSDVSGLFTTASSYDADLATLKNMLNAKKIPYRVFVTTVPLPGSKWSP